MDSADRPTFGILLMLGFCVLIPFADAISKVLGATLPVVMIVLARFVSQTVLLTPLVLRQPRTIGRGQIKAITIRAVLQIIGISLMFFSLLYLPLADAIAIAFVMPFILLLLGWWVLGEVVGRLRLAACAVGFLGTLLVVQPSFANVGWPAVLPVGVAIVYALFVLQTRRLAQNIGAIELQATSGAIATLILVPLLLVGTALGLPQLGFAAPTAWEWALLITTGIVGTAAHLLMTLSLR
ncbi:MAG: EamA family transporter, partial [Pseudomonadota bacterium]